MTPYVSSADRLLAVELSFAGTMRPMERQTVGGRWHDLVGAFTPVNLAPGTTETFVVTAGPNSSALIGVEPLGWVPPYIPPFIYMAGRSWPMGMDEIDYAPVVNSPAVALRGFEFTFHASGLLKWRALTVAHAAATHTGELQLARGDLEFAYVFLRVSGAEMGTITMSGQRFSYANAPGQPAKQSFSI